MRLGKKISTEARTVGQDTSMGSNGFPEDEELDTVNIEPIGGINFSDAYDSATMQDNEFRSILGYYLREGKLDSVPSPVIQTPTKPNSNRVLGLFNINRYSGTRTHLRFTKSSIHRLDAGAWTAITGAALSGADYDRFQLIFVEDQAFFNNNGLDVLQKINLGADTYAAAGNARKYKYYTYINNRIIGANLLAGTNDPTEVAGSGDRNYSEWDPTVDISAFRGSLTEPEDNSIDEITGIINADNKLMVFRSGSIVMGIIQPIASAPFNFIKTFNIGCNAPYSIQKIRNGVIWYDPFQQNVFLYDFKSEQIITIGDTIVDLLKQYAVDLTKLFGSFDHYNNEYELYYEGGFDFTIAFRYNVTEKKWSTHYVMKASCVLNSVSAIATTTIDGLAGTIDGLAGTIDNLSFDLTTPEKLFGTNDGDRVKLASITASVNFVESKLFRTPGYRQHIESIEVDIRCLANSTSVILNLFEEGSLLKYSKIKSLSQNTATRTVRFNVNKNVETFRFQFRNLDNSPRIAITAFRINRYLAGKTWNR